MGLVRQNRDIENWLNLSSQGWYALNDEAFHQLVADWKASFWRNVEIKQRVPYGDKALLKFQNTLPIDGYIFSGIRVETAANMGGCFPLGYYVKGLTQIDLDLCATLELIVSDQDFLYTIVCSHERGCETLYDNS